MMQVLGCGGWVGGLRFRCAGCGVGRTGGCAKDRVFGRYAGLFSGVREDNAIGRGERTK